MVEVIRHLENVKPIHQQSVVTIGNFDGVHLGHQKLLKRVIAKAHELNTKSTVITFEPLPSEYFAGPIATVPRLTRFREKILQIADLGIDQVVILTFNQKLAGIAASDFVHYIYNSLRPIHLIVGDDFHFGAKRAGNFDLLTAKGHELGFGTEKIDTVLIDGERVSSTRVRAALTEDKLDLMPQLLGHPYFLYGKVRHGDKIGRQWGFPTANLFLHRRLTPVKGIYTVLMHDLEKTPIPGVANVGIRPTVDGTRCLLEVHLLNFNKDIYGREVRVEFCKKLREEIRYPNIELLKDQIRLDVIEANNYFKGTGVL